MIDLGAARGMREQTLGSAINERGDVVGIGAGVSAIRGVVWRHGATLEFDALGRETSQCGARGVAG